MLIDLSKDEGEDAHKPHDKEQAPAGDAADEGDAAACIICLEPLTSEGEHRVVALKCGHLFGKSCIEVWVRQKKLCPQCKARAKLHDITPLYGGLPKVAAGKAAEELERQLEAARRQQQQQEQENQRLKDMLQQLQRQQEAQAQAQAQRPLQQLQYQQQWAGPHQGQWSNCSSFQVSGPASFGAMAALPDASSRIPRGRQPYPKERHKNGPWDEEEEEQRQQQQRQQQQQQAAPEHHDHYTRSGKGSKDPAAAHRRGRAAAAAAPAAGHAGAHRGGHSHHPQQPQQQQQPRQQQQQPQQHQHPQQQQQQHGSGAGHVPDTQAERYKLWLQPGQLPAAGQQQWQGGPQVGQGHVMQQLPVASAGMSWLHMPPPPLVQPPGPLQQPRAPGTKGARHGLGEQILQQYEQHAQLQQGANQWAVPRSPNAGGGGGAAAAGAGGSSNQHHARVPTSVPAAAGGGGHASMVGAGQPQPTAAAAAWAAAAARAAAAGGGGQHAVPGAGGHLDHLGLRAQQAQQVLAAIAAIVEGHTPTPLHALTVAAFEEDIRAAEAAAGGGRKRPREEADAGAPTGAASPSKAAAGGATPAAAAAVHARDATHPGLVSSQAGGEAAQREGCWPAAAGGRQRLVFHTTPPASRHPEVPRALNGCLVDPTAAAAAGVGEGLQLQQQFGAVGSRACCLDVQQKVLLLADAPADTGTRIRRVSLLAPQYPQVLRLPGAGLVRALAPSPYTGPGAQLAVGSAQRGLLIASPDAGSIVASVPTPGPVWDVAWSPSSPCQLLLGLDRGRLGVADLRQPRGLLQLVAPTGPPAPQALHSLRVVVGGGGGGPCQQQAGPAYQVLVACSGGVYLWDPNLQSQQQRQQQQQQQQQQQGLPGQLGPTPPDPFQLLLPSSLHGGTCESIAVDPQQQLLAVSFRSRAGSSSSGGGGQPWPGGHAPHPAAMGAPSVGPCMASHWVLQGSWEAEEGAEASHSSQQAVVATQPPAATGGVEWHGPASTTAAAAGPGANAGHHQQLPSLVRGVGGLPLHPGVDPGTLQLRGHTSSDTLTSGCFFRLPCCQGPLFASGDELSRSALIWDCSAGVDSRGAVLQQLGGLPSPLVSIQGGWSEQLGLGLLAAHCQDGVQVWQWEPST